MAVLLSYDFPGSIRELENILEHCFVLCKGNVIETKHLPASIGNAVDQPADISKFRTLRQMEILMIEQALRRNKDNKTLAAKELGINASTLFRKLKNLNIETE
jgi:transcriptional regulator with PAS, ATPase and Fis domain